MKKILVTGGAGYIGSHTTLELLAAGYEVVIVDDLSNSSPECLRRVKNISGKDFTFHEVNLLDRAALNNVFLKEPGIDAVIHFAAKKAVGESVEIPLAYYNNNVGGSLALLETMDAHGVKNLVFSSSATVYGNPTTIPVPESHPTGATSPYGRTKAMMEQILLDTAKAHNWGLIILRYFNPIGAHPSGQIGEDPEYPTYLLPSISQTAIGIRDKVTIFGDDYDTPDGTGVRDFIHVVDLAKAHLKSIQHLASNNIEARQTDIFNIGTGRGYSVKEMVEAFRKISGQEIPIEIGPRREGDIGECTADATHANTTLGWKAEFGLQEMIASEWNWQSKNPKGYRE